MPPKKILLAYALFFCPIILHASEHPKIVITPVSSAETMSSIPSENSLEMISPSSSGLLTPQNESSDETFLLKTKCSPKNNLFGKACALIEWLEDILEMEEKITKCFGIFSKTLNFAKYLCESIYSVSEPARKKLHEITPLSEQNKQLERKWKRNGCPSTRKEIFEMVKIEFSDDPEDKVRRLTEIIEDLDTLEKTAGICLKFLLWATCYEEIPDLFKKILRVEGEETPQYIKDFLRCGQLNCNLMKKKLERKIAINKEMIQDIKKLTKQAKALKFFLTEIYQMQEDVFSSD